MKIVFNNKQNNFKMKNYIALWIMMIQIYLKKNKMKKFKKKILNKLKFFKYFNSLKKMKKNLMIYKKFKILKKVKNYLEILCKI